MKKERNAGIYQAECPYTETDFSSQVFVQPDDSPDIVFAQAFTTIAGQFVYCADEQDFIQNIRSVTSDLGWKNICCLDADIQTLLRSAEIDFFNDSAVLTRAEVGITGCEFLIARLGSIMISSASGSGRRLHVYPDVHVVVARSSQIVPDLTDALAAIREKYASSFPSLVSVISGPSRTADIEKTLVMGAHGPRELFVFLIDDSGNS